MASSEDFEAIFGLKQNGRGHNYDLTNLNLAGQGFGDMGCGLVVECLQFVQQFWEEVWYN